MWNLTMYLCVCVHVCMCSSPYVPRCVSVFVFVCAWLEVYGLVRAVGERHTLHCACMELNHTLVSGLVWPNRWCQWQGFCPQHCLAPWRNGSEPGQGLKVSQCRASMMRQAIAQVHFLKHFEQVEVSSQTFIPSPGICSKSRIGFYHQSRHFPCVKVCCTKMGHWEPLPSVHARLSWPQVPWGCGWDSSCVHRAKKIRACVMWLHVSAS